MHNLAWEDSKVSWGRTFWWLHMHPYRFPVRTWVLHTWVATHLIPACSHDLITGRQVRRGGWDLIWQECCTHKLRVLGSCVLAETANRMLSSLRALHLCSLY